MSSRKSKQDANNKPYSYQQLGAEVQNSKKSRVYVFGNADVQEDEVVEFEMSDVRSRKGGPKPTQKDEDEQLYYERELTEGDTLRSLSLQYGCPVNYLFFGRHNIDFEIRVTIQYRIIGNNF